MLTAPRNGSDQLLDQRQPSRPAYVKLSGPRDIDSSIVQIDSCSPLLVHLVPTLLRLSCVSNRE